MAKRKKDEGIPPERATNVLLEDMRSEIKKIAEGHSGLPRKLEEHDKEFEKIDQRFDILEGAVSENGRDIKELKVNVKQINEKLDKIIINHEDRIKKLEVVR